MPGLRAQRKRRRGLSEFWRVGDAARRCTLRLEWEIPVLGQRSEEMLDDGPG